MFQHSNTESEYFHHTQCPQLLLSYYPFECGQLAGAQHPAADIVVSQSLVIAGGGIRADSGQVRHQLTDLDYSQRAQLAAGTHRLGTPDRTPSEHSQNTSTTVSVLSSRPVHTDWEHRTEHRTEHRQNTSTTVSVLSSRPVHTDWEYRTEHRQNTSTAVDVLSSRPVHTDWEHRTEHSQ